MENKVIVEIPESLWNTLLKESWLKPDHLKEVKIDDAFLKDDETYQILKKASNKSYKDMATYRFNKLNNIRTK